MPIRLRLFAFCLVCLIGPRLLPAQQANVNLDYNSQKNIENLIPFSATENSPEVRDDRTATFRLKDPAAKEVSLSSVALLTALGAGNKAIPFKKGENGIWTLTFANNVLSMNQARQ